LVNQYGETQRAAAAANTPAAVMSSLAVLTTRSGWAGVVWERCLCGHPSFILNENFTRKRPVK
jgi:hypothetical protein